MFESFNRHRLELTELISRKTQMDGTTETDIPSFFFSRHTEPIGPSYGVLKPSVCIIVQGEKEVFLSKERYCYGPADYLVGSVNLPIVGHVTGASKQEPYLSVKLEYTPSQILTVMREAKMETAKKENAKRGMYVSRVEPLLLESVTRLARLLDTPSDIPVLAPLIMKEILYRVLQGEYGAVVRQMAVEGSATNQISDVIEYIMKHYEKVIKIEELADIANMSISTLHRHFKEVTAMSPIQYQKQLRLQEARSLLLAESSDVAEVGFRVGYESPSQFSREYSRMYGLPPKEDILRLKEAYQQRVKA